MKSKLFNSTIVLVLLSSLSNLATVAAAQQMRPAQLNGPFAGASISDFKGRVQVQLPNQAPAGAARGEILPAETVITTEDGGMLLRLVDGSEVIVRSHTGLVLKQPAGNEWRYLQLIIGRIRTAVQKRLGGASPFEIGTPSAVISVRGTRFDVEVNRQNVTEVDVQEGVVQLQGINGSGAAVLITEGMSSRVGLNTGPETPRPTEELRPEVERPEAKEKDKEFERDPGDLIGKLRSDEKERQQDMEEKNGSETGSQQQNQEADPSDPR